MRCDAAEGLLRFVVALGTVELHERVARLLGAGAVRVTRGHEQPHVAGGGEHAHDQRTQRRIRAGEVGVEAAADLVRAEPVVAAPARLQARDERRPRVAVAIVALAVVEDLRDAQAAVDLALAEADSTETTAAA